MWILLFSQVVCQSVQQYAAFTLEDPEIGNWEVKNQHVSNSIFSCGSRNIFGGYQVFGQNSVITNLISLQPHSQIQISLEIWKFGDWTDAEDINVFIDNLFLSFLMNDNEQPCVINDEPVQVKVVSFRTTFEHNFNSVLVAIKTSTVQGFWGMSNFKVLIQPCPSGCVICTSGESKYECIKWGLAFESLSQIDFTTFNTEGWEVTDNKVIPSLCSNIPLLCGYNKCAANDKIQRSIQLIPHTQLKVHFRYFKIDTWDNEFGILNIDSQQIWKQQYNLDQGYDICGYGSKEQGDNIEIYLAHSNQNILFEFTSDLNEFPDAEPFGLRDFQIFINNNCLEYYQLECCGDSIKQREEDCDDGNMIPFDGCHNCQYSCAESCQYCVKGECYNIEEDKVINEIIQMVQVMRIPLITQHNNQIINENCEIEIGNVCLKCYQGYFLVVGECQKICQSYDIEFAILTKEECQCNVDCMNCNEAICNICYEGSSYYDYGCQCEYGFYKIDNQCETQCGDLIVAGVEQCDDQNSDNGCYNCQFVCSKYCIDCYDGVCQEYFETCDDGNRISGDGCSNKCEIEPNWIQNENQEIVYLEESYLRVQFESQMDQYQYVSLTFTTQMKRKSNNANEFQDFIKMKLNIGEQLYTLNLVPIQEAQTRLTWVKYQVEIIINENLDYYPQLEISLLETLYNCYDIPLTKLQQTIKLQKTIYLSESEVLASQKLAATQKTLIYSLGGLGATLILCGFGSVVWTSLDILQEFSYLRFINVDFPQNVMIFFDSADVIQLQYFIQKLNIFFFVSYLDFDNQQTNGKFLYYQINASLVINIQSLIFSLLSLGVFYLICKYFSQILNRFNLRRVQNNYVILYIIQTLSFRTLKLKVLTYKHGFQEMILMNGWSLLFMIFIQIQNGNTYTYIETLLLTLSIVIFMYFTYFVFCYDLKRMLAKCKEAKLDLLFQMKRICFMAVLIFFQQNQKLQVLLLILIYSAYLICLFRCHISLEYLTRIITECSQMIFVITSFCFIFDFSNNKKITLGWFSISLLIFGIASQLLCNLYIAFKQLIRRIKKFSRDGKVYLSSDSKIQVEVKRPQN